MTAGTLEQHESEARSAPRTSMFVTCRLDMDAGSSPATIRNLSPTGALVEAAVVPTAGKHVTLSRGSLVASGEVIWFDGNRFGIRFCNLVHVQSWLGSLHNREQLRVDEIFRAVKTPQDTRANIAMQLPAAEALTPAQLAEDLARISILVEQLGDRLAADPAIVTECPTELQYVDLVVQTLACVSNCLATGAPTSGSTSKLQSLRNSVLQALTCVTGEVPGELVAKDAP